jgi:hypothetical protein
MKADENRRGAEKKVDTHRLSPISRRSAEQEAKGQTAEQDEEEVERETKVERWHSFKTP